MPQIQIETLPEPPSPAEMARRRRRRPVAGWLVIVLGVGVMLVAPSGLVLQWSTGHAAWFGAVDWIIIGLGFGITTTGRQMLARDAAHIRLEDPRPPIVYLRPFKDDGIVFPRSGWRSRRKIKWGSLLRYTYEEKLKHALRGLGPMLAVGNPGDDRPPLGAARVYVSGKKWRRTVMELVSEAQLLIVHAGTTEGVLWELRQLVDTIDPRKIVISLSMKEKDGDQVDDSQYEQFRQRAHGIFPKRLPARAQGARFLLFGSDWTPQPLRMERHVEATDSREGQVADVLQAKAVIALRSEFGLVSTPVWQRLAGVTGLMLATAASLAFLAYEGVGWAMRTTLLGVFASRQEVLEEYRPRIDSLLGDFRELANSLPDPGATESMTIHERLDPVPSTVGSYEGASNAAIVMESQLWDLADTVDLRIPYDGSLISSLRWWTDTNPVYRDVTRAHRSLRREIDTALKTRYLVINRIVEEELPFAVSADTLDQGFLDLEGTMIDLTSRKVIAVYRIVAQANLEYGSYGDRAGYDPITGLTRIARSSIWRNARDSVIKALGSATGGTYVIRR